MTVRRTALRRPSLPSLRSIGACVCFFCIGGGGGATAQQSVLLSNDQAKPQPAPEVSTKDATPTFTTRVNLVPVSVVVRDDKGHAIGSLTKEDFQLSDNGKPQVIARFSVERTNAPVHLQKEVKTNEESEDAVPAKPEPVLATHFVAYLFDDVHLKFGDLAYVRDAAARHVATSLQPSDRAAVYTTSGRVALEFTDDRAALQGALARLRPSPITGGPGPKCPDISYYMADLIINKNDGQALQVALANYQICSGNNYATGQEVMMFAQSALSEGEHETLMAARVLKDVVRRISAMPGQRSIILTSPGFFMELHDHSEITEIITKAISAKVIVNSLDSRGVWTEPGYDASSPSPAGGAHVITMMNLYAHNEAMIEGEVLGEVAEGTGGTWIHDNNDITGAFQRLAAPPEFIYVLAYSPDNLKSDGKYHNIKVTMRNSKGLSLQSRKGYFAPRRETSPAEQARQDLEDAVFTREVVKDIPVELHTQFFKPTEDTARLTVMARLDLRSLQFHKAEDRSLDKLVLVAALFDTGGNYIAGMQKDVELRLKDETLATFSKPSSNGLTIRTSFDVKPGNYVVRLVLRDGGSNLMASENGVVEIP